MPPASLWRPRACFICGSPDHFRKDCPQLLKKEAEKPSTDLTPARVFAWTKKEVEASPSVVTGQILSAGFSYTILFDFGATHSFVAARVIDKLCMPSLVLDRGF